MAAVSLGTAREGKREGLAMKQTKRFQTHSPLGESETRKGNKGYTSSSNSLPIPAVSAQIFKVDVKSVHCLEQSTLSKLAEFDRKYCL